MQEFIRELNQLVTDHWVKFVTATAFAAFGWLLARYRADRDWKRREFFNRLNVSLNSIVDGTLKIRTLSEKLCSEVFLNQVAVERLIHLAQTTTKTNPLVPISRDDSWFYLNSVLNELSEQFADGLIRREAGRASDAVRFLVCLTNECDGDVRTRKIRAMVIRRDLLLSLPEEAPKFESPNHAIRWQTLQQMQKACAAEPWRFIEVEIVI